MNHRRNARLLGFLYILAAVTAVVAVLLYEPIMETDWYKVVNNGQEINVLLGVINDVALVVSVAGTAIILAPYLKSTSPRLSLAYFSFRYMEAVFLAIGLVAILVLVYISDAYTKGVINDIESMQVNGLMLQGIHRWTMVLGPNFMLGINTFIYSYLLNKSELIPKKLANFGIVVSVMVFISGILDMFGVIEPWSTIKGLTSLPLGVYEISLALYLIVKGFKVEALSIYNHQNDITSDL